MNSLAREKRNFIIAALTIPTVLLIHLAVFPATGLFRMSFTNWDRISSSSDLIRSNNHKFVPHNVDLRQSLGNNAVYFVVRLCIIPVELASAVLLTSRLKAVKFYETMVSMPYIVNGIMISCIFSYFFSPVNGALDVILEALHMGALFGKGWLSAPGIMNSVLSFVFLQRSFGYHVILFMAVLQSLPQDVQGAARVDGANAWRMLKFIQVPTIMLMVDFILSDNIKGSLQVSDIPFVMISGGPGYVSSTFTLYTIETAFSYSNSGLAFTMTAAIVATILVIYLVQNRIIHGIVLRGGK